MASELIDEDDELGTKKLLEAAERVLPGCSRDVTWTQVDRWDPMVVAHAPGYTRELSKFHDLCRANDHTIQLAGDYWAVSSLNTATASGERAGRSLAAALARGHSPT